MINEVPDFPYYCSIKQKSMDKKCKSCGLERIGLFCSHCGQKHIQGLTWKFLLLNVLDLIEMNRGFLYNLKSLNIRPKTFYNEYLSGATNKAMPPIPYAFISLAIVSYLSSILINLNVGLSGSEIFEVEDLWFQNFTIWIAVYYVVISLIYFLSKYNFLESLIFSLFAVPQLQFYIITGDLFCYIFELNGELNSLLYLLIIVFFIVRNFKLKYKKNDELDKMSSSVKWINKRNIIKFFKFIIMILLLFFAGVSIDQKKETDRAIGPFWSNFLEKGYDGPSAIAINLIPILNSVYLTSLAVNATLEVHNIQENLAVIKSEQDEFNSFVKKEIQLMDSSSQLIEGHLNAILQSLRFIEDSILYKNGLYKFSHKRFLNSIDDADIYLNREIESYNDEIRNTHLSAFEINWWSYEGLSNYQVIENLLHKERELLLSSTFINSKKFHAIIN